MATAEDLRAVERLVGALPPNALKELLANPAIAAELKKPWRPNPGPQSDAYYSLADVLLYGGEPGGGKSQLILGLAFNCHERSLIMRRQYGDLERLIDDALTMHGSRDGFNGSPPPRLRISERQVISFRAAQRIGDEHGTMGQGRDLLGVDEATHFAESQIRFLMGWVRTETEGQRTRTVLATNPPLTADGLWVHQMFAPWLDPNYPFPAKPGELRWVVSDTEGKDEWVSGPDDVRVVNSKTVRPMSRTYIPASVKDNPYYAATDYERTLDSLPEPYRSILMGGFRATFKDHDFQVIPTLWIEAAQARWKPDGHKGLTMTAMGLDPAGGGRDSAELIARYGGWYAVPVSAKGSATADGTASVSTVIKHRRDACPIVVDVGGGYAGAVIERFKDNQIPYLMFNGAAKSTAKAKQSGLLFGNRRAEAWWRFREELDPDQQNGSGIALPPDPELKADLATPRWEISGRGILLEDKDEIRKRIGRSPGKGDACVMALSEGNKAAMQRFNTSGGGRMPIIHMGYENVKRRA